MSDKIGNESWIERLKRDQSEFKHLGRKEEDIVEDVNLFECKGEDRVFNERLQTREGFAKSLVGQWGDKIITEEDAKKLYDRLSELDGEDGMSKKELSFFASLSDCNQGEHKIDDHDILAFLEVCECGCEEDCYNLNADNHFETKAVIHDDSRIKIDENGANYIKVEKWSSEDSSKNCELSRIISHCYDLEAMGIEKGSDVYKELEKAVMDANPEIYGTEEGGWRNGGSKYRKDAMLKVGEKFIIPDFDLTKCGCSETQTISSDRTSSSSGGSSKPTPTPSSRPTSRPTSTPKPEATQTPSTEPTEEEIEIPEKTEQPSHSPVVKPTPTPEVTPTPKPEVTPTPKPEVTPTPEPEVTPTPKPEVTPTPEPEVTPTPKPTPLPTPNIPEQEMGKDVDAVEPGKTSGGSESVSTPNEVPSGGTDTSDNNESQENNSSNNDDSKQNTDNNTSVENSSQDCAPPEDEKIEDEEAPTL